MVISVNQQAWFEHKIRNYMFLPAITGMAADPAPSWPAGFKSDFSIQGKTSGNLSPLSVFIES